MLKCSKKVREIRSTLIQYLVELNKTWNRSICDKFDQMATKLGEIPEETSVLVQLQRYLKISITETTPELMKRIKMASQRVLFLLDYTIFPTEDIQLNTRVFQWPQDMAAVFELAKKRTGHKRDQIEEILRDEIDRFEDNLKQTKKELDVFIKKDPPVLTMEEMKTSVGVVERLEKTICRGKG
ncbi:DNAH [Lepeophtheirus salmonis]|uniref:DNAH n=1 Tax=Lepeophtheirus salmonis TaxID=72036 RepID=A0A7R8D4N2_LEPSM|nr:DNAH [Lepeophtheirus salmonis]CAF3025435.1 DNAH [Lepeophtheirus salmonis]